MKYYEIWQNNSGTWGVYQVTNDGQTYQLIKHYRTKKGAENWAKRQWYNVIWR